MTFLHCDDFYFNSTSFPPPIMVKPKASGTLGHVLLSQVPRLNLTPSHGKRRYSSTFLFALNISVDFSPIFEI